MLFDLEWMEYLRYMCPKGSRIKLRKAKDSDNSMKAESMGTLERIDDSGHFYVQWDDGRTLSLVLGEDHFSVLPPETTNLKLYMPLAADFYKCDESGFLLDESTSLDSRELLAFEDSIHAEMGKNCHPDEKECGVMFWYYGNDVIADKVLSAFFTSEARDGQLWGVAECQVVGTLESKELDVLKEFITLQAYDGWGNDMEHREIKVKGGGALYVHLWSNDSRWRIRTEQELFEKGYKAIESVSSTKTNP